jgi:putative addiction module killer protein
MFVAYRLHYIMIIKIQIYETPSGKHPFLEWLVKLDRIDKAIINGRIARVELYNFGNCKPISGPDDLWEIVVDYGPGYRIYFGMENRANIIIITLLLGGKKDTQSRDIATAAKYLALYKGKKREKEKCH